MVVFEKITICFFKFFSQILWVSTFKKGEKGIEGERVNKIVKIWMIKTEIDMKIEHEKKNACREHGNRGLFNKFQQKVKWENGWISWLLLQTHEQNVRELYLDKMARDWIGTISLRTEMNVKRNPF